MAEPLIPAKFALQGSVPYSERFEDVYHSTSGGLAQADYVFLKGNRLPDRWAGRERFVILETGFGLGLNFLATWRAWRGDPARCGRLHFVSIEKHPFSLQDLRTLHARYSEVQGQAAELHSAWPVLVPGGHRLVFEGGAVVLTLFLADIKVARELRLSADAIYLDGFAPAKNPEMWSPQTLRAISRLAAPAATLATWSVAGTVRDALQATGFEAQKLPGFGNKREMLCAVYRGRAQEAKPAMTRKATVVGAGLAGAAVCERLCARGWEVTLVERQAAPAQEASGNHAGAFHPIVTPDDSVFARLTRAGFLYALSNWKKHGAIRWDPCGALQLSRNEKEEASQRASIANLGLPPEYAQLVTQEAASAHAGVPVAAGGLWFPQAGWVKPQSLVDSLLDACGSRLKRIFGENFSIGKEADGQTIVLATADDALQRIAGARLRRVRGQLTYLREDSLQPPHVVVLRGGMVLPSIDGLCVVGASFDIDDEDPRPRADSDAGNLERVQRILPGFVFDGNSSNVNNRVAFRTVARDRLPIVGRIAGNVYACLALGSRGLIWSSLAAEIIASDLEGEPLPLEGKLADAMGAIRFAGRPA
jgi:tRNA 5-methylaminomethyl-2-thiouridine biosynthesis bifunctional protein